MKKYIKSIIFFTAGLLFGSLLMLFIFALVNQSQFSDQYNQDLIEMSYLMTELKGKDNTELIKRLDKNLPQYVLIIHSDDWLKNSKLYLEAMWSVKNYYNCSKTQIPEEIEQILKNLPPSPKTSCSVKFKRNK